VSALDLKLLRDLAHLRGQVIAIALVMAAGLAVLVMSLGSVVSLEETRRAYYERAGFAHVFAALERAPDHLAARLEAIAGVRHVETRIVREVVLDVAGFAEPVTGRLISLPAGGAPRLNRPMLDAGRLPAAGALDEVVLSAAFAAAHGLRPGDAIAANINGKRRRLAVVGTANSPEYVYALPPGGLMPDDLRFGVGWVPEPLLAAAFDMEGAFNDASLTLAPSASERAVIAAVDRLLAPYGGIGAIGRDDQLSNWFLSSEIRQLKTIATVMPSVFLAVAAFLMHMATSRLIALERREIGLLKAFGYRDLAVAWHYTRFALAIAALATALGLAGGWWLGRTISVSYAEVFHFPFLAYRLDPKIAVGAAAVALAVASLGALAAVRRALRLPPAVAMRPEPPPAFARRGGGGGVAARLGLDTLTRMVLRRVVRSPLRAGMTVLGVAAAGALLIGSLHWIDSIDALIVSHFERTERFDLRVTFAGLENDDALEAIRALPGVVRAEPTRALAADLRYGLRAHRGAVDGLVPGSELRAVRDVERGVFRPSSGGLVIGDELARKLAVEVGDRLEVAFLEGRRRTVTLPVAAVVETYIGTPAYLALDRLNTLAGDGDVIDGAVLRVDAAREAELFAALKASAAIAAVSSKTAAMRSFDETLAETIHVIVGFYIAFAGMVAFGVVYTGARITLSERARELASLRVLGFTRGEISYILVGELALVTAAALPAGAALGWLLALGMGEAFANELYRVPFVIRPRTYGIALVTVLAATAVAAFAVRRRLDRLDLVAVLKTRE